MCTCSWLVTFAILSVILLTDTGAEALQLRLESLDVDVPFSHGWCAMITEQREDFSLAHSFNCIEDDGTPANNESWILAYNGLMSYRHDIGGFPTLASTAVSIRFYIPTLHTFTWQDYHLCCGLDVSSLVATTSSTCSSKGISGNTLYLCKNLLLLCLHVDIHNARGFVSYCLSHQYISIEIYCRKFRSTVLVLSRVSPGVNISRYPFQIEYRWAIFQHGSRRQS